MAIVVDADGVNCPRIHVDTKPDSGCHAAPPALATVLADSKATRRTPVAGAVPSCRAISASSSSRTARLTSISSGVPA
jgi:hypothetical protein